MTRAVGAVGRQGHQRLAVFYHHGGYTTPRRKACRPRPGPIHATRHRMTLKASKCVRGTEGLLCVQRWRWSRGCSTTRQEVEQRWRWSRGGGAEADAGSGAAQALCVARLLVTAQLARHLTSDGPLGSRSTSRIVSVSTAHALFLRSCATVMDTTVTLRLRLCPWMYSTLDKPYACASLRPQPLTLDATHTHCEQVLQGEHVVKAIETVGSASGAPSSAVRIRDCGVV